MPTRSRCGATATRRPRARRAPTSATSPTSVPTSASRSTPGTAPWLANIYCFNYGASASLGKVSGDIPGISEGAAWLTRSLAATLYREDVAAHFQGMVDYTKPELLGDEWTESPLEPQAEVPLQGTGDD